MLYFDAHVHIGNFKIVPNELNQGLLMYQRYSKNSPEHHYKYALSHNISKAVIFPFPIMEIPFALQNDYVISAAKRFPYYYIPFVLPEDTCFMEAKKKDFVGIKDHFYLDFNTQVNHNAVLEFAQENAKVYLFHAHWKHWGDRIKLICARYPRLQVIIAHSARTNPFNGRNLSIPIKELKELIPTKLRDNFFFETSTIREKETIEQIVKAFGAEQVLWGSDFPMYASKGEDSIQSELDSIITANVSEEDKEKIFSKNFRKLYQFGSVWIRHCMPDDSSKLLDILTQINSTEQKYLAIAPKLKHIKEQIKHSKNILIAEDDKGILCGFLRWSDRHNSTVVIEELYVLPEARRMNTAGKLIEAIAPAYKFVEAKTYAENKNINNLFAKLDFTPEFSPKRTMILWKKQKA